MQNKVLEEIFRTNSKSPSENDGVLRQLGSALESINRDSSGRDKTFSTPAEAFASLLIPGSLNAAINQSGQQNLQGGVPGASNQISELFGDLSKHLDTLRTASETQTAGVGANTQAITTNTATKAASQAVASVSDMASGLFGGLTALPIISGIMKLFGSGTATTQQPLVKYVAPTPLHFENVTRDEAGTQTMERAGYDRYGDSRPTSSSMPAIPSYSSLLAGAQYGNNNGDSGTNMGGISADPTGQDLRQSQDLPSLSRPATQVTVNVQAMDSKSFLDRSHDIAHAVREAMLNMHAINDVVNDL